MDINNIEVFSEGSGNLKNNIAYIFLLKNEFNTARTWLVIPP